jgi:hypothetical protein
MLSSLTQKPRFARLSDGIVAPTASVSRFAFLMTMFRDIDDRPYLNERARELEDEELAAMDRDPVSVRH